MSEGDSLANGIDIVDQLARESDGLEDDQLSWRLNDALRDAGIDAVPVHVELIRRGKSWYWTPLLHVTGPQARAAALPALLDTPDADPRRLGELIDSCGPDAVPALADFLARRSAEPEGDCLVILAVEALGELRSAAAPALPDLVAVLRGVRYDPVLIDVTVNALAAIDGAGPATVGALADVLARAGRGEIEASWCGSVFEILGRFDPAARGAELQLRIAQTHPDPDFRRSAGETLIHDPVEGVRFFALRSSRVRTRSLTVW